MDDLFSEIKAGTIFSFPYSYRGGLEPDTAFLLTNEDGKLMMVVGNLTKCELVGIEASAPTTDEDDDNSAEDIMDFDMI